MEILKVITLAIAVTILSVIFKQYKPEYSINISIVAGIVIFMSLSEKIYDIYNYIDDLCSTISIDIKYINLLFKVTGIGYMCEFASTICKDAGETTMAFKIDMAGKITLIYLAFPIFEELLIVLTEVAL